MMGNDGLELMNVGGRVLRLMNVNDMLAAQRRRIERLQFACSMLAAACIGTAIAFFVVVIVMVGGAACP